MERLLYAVIALLVWPAVLWQLASFYLGSDKAINQMKTSQADLMQEDQFWKNAEPIIGGLLAFVLIYSGWVWAGLYVALGTLVALAYQKVAKSI